MTFRARPVTKRPGRPGWDAGERRNTLINAGFLGAIVISILILAGYAGWTWYDNHFGAAGAVNGQTITKDDVRARLVIENFRIDYTEAQVRALFANGHITQTVESQQLDFLNQRRQSLTSITLEKLIDVMLQGKLASDAGITVSDAEVDAQLLKEATVGEQRHAWVIEVEPVVDPTTGQIDDVQKADAKAKADAALAQLTAGKSWDDVAKTTSTATSAPQAGDLGWIPQDSGYDGPFTTAVFAAAKDVPTDVIEGDDGIFRIGRVTDISAPTVDQAFQAKLADAGIKLADYRVAVRGDVIRQKLSDMVVADLSKPSLQRHVQEIFLKAITTPVPDGVLVRHILFAPNDDPNAATKLTITDPAWDKAKADAEAAYQVLLKDPTKFDELARTESDDPTGKDAGGKLGFVDANTPLDSTFAKQIFAPGLKPGQILPPFRSVFGWHVVQFMRPYGDGNEAWLGTLKTQADAGANFLQLAIDQSDSDATHKAGDIGWIAKGQLGDAREGPIFDATIGKTTTVVDIANDGDYLFKVLAEETRPATPEQIAIFKQTGFTDWYSLKKAAAKIDRNLGDSAATS
jgi:parvulin-like peptidyl-prolyl isomerase